MVGITPASHGDFAKGILQSGEMIFGTQPNVKTVTLQPSEGPDDIRARMEEAITTFENPKRVLFMVDPQGGIPPSQTSRLINDHGDTWTVVTGLNLPMLIEAFASRMSMESVQETAAHVYRVAEEEIWLLPGTLEPAQEKQATEPMTPQGVIPEEAVIGGGYIKYMLARIDSRLLHRQAATTWTRTVKPTRVIVVSDDAAKDELRKNLIEQATLPGVKANVVPADRVIQVTEDPRFGNTKAMLLFETPQDVLHAIKGSVDVKELDIGSMIHSVGKIAVNKVLSLSKDDIKTLEKLKAKGIQSNVRKVPNDPKENMDDVTEKIKAELA